MESRVWAMAAFGAVLCLAGCTHQQVEVARQVVAVDATSISQTPPSSVFLPGASQNDDSRRAKTVTGSKPNGLGAQIIELRGWLRRADRGCNPEDPDWHWDLVLDPIWADHLGVDLNEIITPGSINVFSDERLVNTPQIVVGRPVVHVELNGFPPKREPAGFPAPPADSPSSDWGFSDADSHCAKAKWAFNPTNPLSWQQSLRVNQYVRIVGSLVSDEPHAEPGGVAWLITELHLDLGTPAVGGGSDPAPGCTDVPKCQQTVDLQKDWEGRRAINDVSNPSRWTEIHPPDIISVLNDVDSSGAATLRSSETVEAVTVFSANCLTDLTCTTRSLDVDIPAPLPEPAGASRVKVLECVGPETNLGTITEGRSVNGNFAGATVTASGADSAHIHVAVRGQAAWGAPGKFKAIYRVFWDTHKPNPPATCHLVL